MFMGAQAHTSLRFGLGRFTTAAEVDRAVDVVATAVQSLRELSPLWEMMEEVWHPQCLFLCSPFLFVVACLGCWCRVARVCASRTELSQYFGGAGASSVSFPGVGSGDVCVRSCVLLLNALSLHTFFQSGALIGERLWWVCRELTSRPSSGWPTECPSRNQRAWVIVRVLVLW